MSNHENLLLEANTDFVHKYNWYGVFYPEVSISKLTVEQERKELQQTRMPNLVGEYQISFSLCEMGISNNDRAVVETLFEHCKSTGYSNTVFGGYRARNLIEEGVLFGKHSNTCALLIRDSRQFSAVSKEYWKEKLGFAKNNPFNHMVRGQTADNAGPALVAYDANQLVEVDQCLYRPKEGISIEETVVAAYYPQNILPNNEKTS